MTWKVLATARAFWATPAENCELLRDHEIIRSPTAGPLPERELIPLLAGCQAVIASSDVYNERVFRESPDLRIVARCGVGIDSVDLAAATAAGVVVTNTPGAMADAVADYTLGLMLAAARHIPEGDAAMRAGEWGQYTGPLLWDKTVGLIGFGDIGQRVALRCRGFQMKILACDPRFQKGWEPPPDQRDVRFVDLDTLLAESDFVSIHAPALPQTRNLIDAARLGRMKKTAFLLNTARGSLVNEEDLMAALSAGTIAGAGIDVYQQEPLPADHPLRRTPRLVLTPHNAFNAEESVIEMCRQSALSVAELFDGRRPVNVCNPEVWDRRRH